MRDFWSVDDNTVVFVADPSLGMNICFLNTNSFYSDLNFLDNLLTLTDYQSKYCILFTVLMLVRSGSKICLVSTGVTKSSVFCRMICREHFELQCGSWCRSQHSSKFLDTVSREVRQQILLAGDGKLFIPLLYSPVDCA